MKTHSKLVTGPILILAGILLLLGQSIHWRAFSFLWLVLLLAAGVVMLVLYIQGRKHPALLSAGVLVTLLSLHFFALRWGWVHFDSSWPFFLLAPGLAFLAVAAADRQNKDALAPAITLISIAVLCYLFTLGILAWILRLIIGILRFLVRYLLPLGLIAWGILLLVERREERQLGASAEEVPPAPDASPSGDDGSTPTEHRSDPAEDAGGTAIAGEVEVAAEVEIIEEAEVVEEEEPAGGAKEPEPTPDGSEELDEPDRTPPS